MQALAAPKGWVASGKLSPDGKRVLVIHDGRLAVVTVGKPEAVTPVEGGPEHIERGGIRLVAGRQADRVPASEPGEFELVVANPDGRHATVIRSSKADGIWKVYWR